MNNAVDMRVQFCVLTQTEGKGHELKRPVHSTRQLNKTHRWNRLHCCKASRRLNSYSVACNHDIKELLLEFRLKGDYRPSAGTRRSIEARGGNHMRRTAQRLSRGFIKVQSNRWKPCQVRSRKSKTCVWSNIMAINAVRDFYTKIRLEIPVEIIWPLSRSNSIHNRTRLESTGSK